MGILQAATTPLCTRVYVMTIAVLVRGVGCTACFGFPVAGWARAEVGASAARLGTGFGMLVHPRPIVTSIRTVRGDGYAEEVADEVLLTMAMYAAALFPLTSDRASDKDQEPRRAAFTGSPPTTACPVPFACRRPLRRP